MLHLFDMDDTLIRSYMRHGKRDAGEPKRMHRERMFDIVEVLPGRREKLHELRNEGHRIAIATNQGGVAFGYQSVDQVNAKLWRVKAMLGLPSNTPCYTSFKHPGGSVPEFTGEDGMRKPKPGMLLQACREHLCYPQDSVYVGDMVTDLAAANAAMMKFAWAEDFFAVKVSA